MNRCVYRPFVLLSLPMLLAGCGTGVRPFSIGIFFSNNRHNGPDRAAAHAAAAPAADHQDK